MSWRRGAFGIAVVVLLALAGPGSAGARLAVRILARVPAPGYPANSVVAPDGTIYVGTFRSFTASAPSGPSKVFAFSPAGRLLRSYTVLGQAVGQPDAVQVATRDRAGTLYLLDQSPARVVTLDPRTGVERTWATFASLPACSSVRSGTACSAGLGGQPPEPDFAAWGPDGSLYVTDYAQALIWRIGPGGGRALPWLTSSTLDGIIVGPAGIALMPGGRALMIGNGANVSGLAAGQLYTVPIEPGGAPGALHELWQSLPGQAPDGIALARSGDVYVSLVGPTGNAVAEVSPTGRELALVPSNPLVNAAMAIPFDAPGSVTFDGNSLIVTNEASLDNVPSHWALLQIDAGEPGLPPSLPPLRAAPPRVARVVLQVRPHTVTAGRRTRLRFLAVTVEGPRREALGGAVIRLAGRRARTNRFGRASLTLTLRRTGRHRATLRAAGRRRTAAVILVRR
jgi:sugar lactone lactonase YvrE